MRKTQRRKENDQSEKKKHICVWEIEQMVLVNCNQKVE